MKRVIILLCLANLALADDKCANYFNERKAILDAKILEADEARQELESFKAAFLALQEQKNKELNEQQAKLEKDKKELMQLKEQLDKQQNDILASKDKAAKQNLLKVALAYAKMKDAAAAMILEKMSDDEALDILLALEAKKISSILPKMQPERAAILSVKLAKLQKSAK